MYIQDFQCSWMSNPFWSKTLKLSSLEELTKLQTSGIQEVVIDTNKGLDVAEMIDDVEPEDISEEDIVEIQYLDQSEYVPNQKTEQVKSLTPVSAQEELALATKAIHSSKKAVASMFNDVRMGKAISQDAATSIVEELTDSVTRNSSALISLVRLKTQDDYTYMHSVAVCALMVALARQLKLTDAETKQAGLAGLLHDIGKAAIPNDVLNKPGALTDEEFALIKLHPQRGHEMLLQANIMDSVALDVCLHHHEKIDGSGYPKALKSEQISLFAKMGAVCDVYDAVTSNRAYKPGWEPGLSLQRMAQWKNHFDDAVFKAFVKSVGIYPMGAVVKLKSNRLAVVMDQTSSSLLKPIVKVFFSTIHKNHVLHEVLDLSNPKVNEEIIGQEDPAIWGIENVNSLWTTQK